MSSGQNGKSKYRPLRGLRWSSGRSTLRLADDHLLLCDYRTGFVERYKRFYFRDIEALIVRKTMHWIVGIAIWGFIALCIFIIGTGTRWNPFLYITEGICLLFILWQAIRGPSCQTHIQTAVQGDRLPMLKRLWKTERVLRQIIPLVEEAQGKDPMEPEGITTVVPRVDPAATVPQTSVPVALDQQPLARSELSWVHAIAFILALFDGLMAIWEVNFPSSASFIGLILVFCLSAMVGIVALVRQAKHRVHGGAATMVWVLVISYVAGGAWLNTGYSLADQFITMQRLKGTRLEQPAPFHEISPFRMRLLPGFDYVLWIFGIFSIILGLVGLAFTLKPAPRRFQPPPLPYDRT